MTDKGILINKYRPQSFDQVLGQEGVCKSIQVNLRKGRGRSFLLSGPSGVGKTTIGRLIAAEVGSRSLDTIEIDGATNSGVEHMREITSHLGYRTLGGKARTIIVDECHSISAQAWKSLLKNIEEPPEGIYWVLCTTDYAKVPKEIKTRCLDYKLREVPRASIFKLISDVARSERLPIRTSKTARGIIATNAEGSPRLALSMLAQCGHTTDEEEVDDLCTRYEGSTAEAIELCRLFMGRQKPTLSQALDCIKKIEAPPETVRIIVLRYMTAVILKSRRNQDAVLAIMEEFSEPFQDREGKAPLVLACARLLLG